MKKAILLFATLFSGLLSLAQSDSLKIEYDDKKTTIYSDFGLTILISNLKVISNQTDQIVSFDYKSKTRNVDSLFLEVISKKRDYQSLLIENYYQGDIIGLSHSGEGMVSFVKLPDQQMIQFTINIVRDGRFIPVIIKVDFDLESNGEIKNVHQIIIDRNQFLSNYKCP